MDIKNGHRFITIQHIFGAVLLVILFCCFSAAMAAQEPSAAINENPEEQQQSAEEEYSEKVKELMHFLAGKTDTFVYKRTGRPDPFMPFISEKVIATATGSEEKEVLVGMRRFEPGQLSLVAIVFTEEGPVAMVQDSVGKGYVIRNGTEIGRSGIVEEISDNIVVIKQHFKTSTGEERYKIVRMLLKKEGEQYQ